MTLSKNKTPDTLTLQQRALGYLSRREHTRQELSQKLAPHAATPEILSQLLSELQQSGWLSDQRYAEQFVASHKSRYGCLKLVHQLQSKGVDEATIEQAMDTVDDTRNAYTAWVKKFGTPPATRQEWAKQARFLQGRGFRIETIRRVLDSRDAPDFLSDIE